MIEHKLEPGTPDHTCRLCIQQIDGVCRAFSVPHSAEEAKRRTGPYGMECDDPRIKEIRKKRFGIKYHT